MQKERWLKGFTDSKKIKSSRSFILEIVRGIWMNYCQHSAVTHPCNSCSLFKGNHTGWCWTQLRAEVCTESSLPVRTQPAQPVAAGFHWQALRSSQLTHRLEESVFHSHREIWLLTGLRRFLPWDRCRKKEHPMVYLHPFAVCYIQNSRDLTGEELLLFLIRCPQLSCVNCFVSLTWIQICYRKKL